MAHSAPRPDSAEGRSPRINQARRVNTAGEEPVMIPAWAAPTVRRPFNISTRNSTMPHNPCSKTYHHSLGPRARISRRFFQPQGSMTSNATSSVAQVVR